MKNFLIVPFLETLVRKGNVLFFLAFFFLSFNAFSQVSQQTELDIINHKIESLRTKRNFVLNNPSEKAEAEQSGWFDEIDQHLNLLFGEKREIILSQTGKIFVSIEEFQLLPSDKQNSLVTSPKHILEVINP